MPPPNMFVLSTPFGRKLMSYSQPTFWIWRATLAMTTLKTYDVVNSGSPSQPMRQIVHWLQQEDLLECFMLADKFQHLSNILTSYSEYFYSVSLQLGLTCQIMFSWSSTSKSLPSTRERYIQDGCGTLLIFKKGGLQNKVIVTVDVVVFGNSDAVAKMARACLSIS